MNEENVGAIVRVATFGFVCIECRVTDIRKLTDSEWKLN